MIKKFATYLKTIPYLILLASCATYDIQSSKAGFQAPSKKAVSHTVYLAGGLGNSSKTDSSTFLQRLGADLSDASANSTLVFIGDMVSSEGGDWSKDSLLLERHIALAREFQGEVIFLPGNNEWVSYETGRIEKMEDYIKDLGTDKLKWYPENACPIEYLEVNEQLDLILIDSRWFLANWSGVLDINKKCTNIVTRRRFVEELEGYINDAQNKNVIIALHHPVFSNGEFAGKRSFKDAFLPIPLLSTFLHGLGDLGAFDSDELNALKYRYLRIAVSALSQSSDRMTVVSGHEESLQYLSGEGLHQIISGSLGSFSATKRSEDILSAVGGTLKYEGVFTAGKRGYAKLEYFEDGSSRVCFIIENEANEYCYNVLPPLDVKKNNRNYQSPDSTTAIRRVLTEEDDYQKSGFYRFLWGERYRRYFGKEVSAPVAMLDTLYGGLSVVKEGGGHQSFSLRLEDAQGRQFAMRSLQKSALKFLKFKLPGIAYNQEDYKDTWAERVVSDFFTTAHPYMQLVVDPLAKAVGVNHSDSELLYIPKQAALEGYNDNFGDELYFVERRPSDEQKHYKGYRRTIDDQNGKITDFESTTDMLEKIKEDESYRIDELNFIRARIFDMLVGDWDRHQDQWRWVEFETEDGQTEFMPVPRDRDNVFGRFDGFALKWIKLFAPTTRAWRNYGPQIKSPKWLNYYGFILDRRLVKNFGVEAWVNQAKEIQEKLDQKVIDSAFSRLPKEVRDSTATFVKSSLISRLNALDQTAKDYAQYLNKIAVLHGTEKDDRFEIIRLENGNTRVIIKRILTDEKDPIIYDRTFKSTETEELWIYGLGDDDVFVIDGPGKAKIMVRCIGGYGDDSFQISQNKKLKIYDWKHEKTSLKGKKPRKQLSSIYRTNTLHWRYLRPSFNKVVPNLGFRTDDGVFLGLTDTYVKNGFNGNPYRQKHQLGVNYYFGFQAVELDYQGSFGNVIPGLNLDISGYYTSDRYSKNFFNFGNETQNQENLLSRDFYRARLRQLKGSIGISLYTLKLRGVFESIRVNENPQRLFNLDNLDPEVFRTQNYAGIELSGSYKNKNAGDYPTKGLSFGFIIGYKTNLNLQENHFGYAGADLGIDQKIDRSGRVVISSRASWKTNIGDGTFFFYHAPSIGGDNGLRGFRDERFTGRSYFFHSTDIKLKLKQYITPVSPVTIGLYGGFDYGRVWVRADSSQVLHTSQGLGFWISSLKALTFNAGYFNSKENNMVQVGLGVSF